MPSAVVEGRSLYKTMRRFTVGTAALPLAGLRVIEMGQLIAGPFAGSILGYFGAEVIKVESKDGDPLR